MKEIIVRVAGYIFTFVIGKGLLIWLGSQHGIYPEQWVAKLIGIAEDGVTSYPAISYVLVGILGLIGLFIGPSIYKLGKKLFGSENDAETEQTPNTPKTRLNDWSADEKIIKSLSSRANQYTNVKIIYFDSRNFPFSERLASAFELAGWKVNFNKTAQGNYNPHYYGGVEVKGDNRILVESVATILESSGCIGVTKVIGTAEIKPGHPKYQHAQNKIHITIGYEE